MAMSDTPASTSISDSPDAEADRGELARDAVATAAWALVAALAAARVLVPGADVVATANRALAKLGAPFRVAPLH